MIKIVRKVVTLPARYYFWGSLASVLVCLFVISGQVADRQGFARGELRRDVIERWAAPIRQAAPSVRYVESGAVFNRLTPLPLGRQDVHVDAAMSYRKRGLIEFSGFEFGFRGEYEATNPEDYDIDIVFVFPVEVERRSMLSDLEFFVNGEPAPLPLAESANRLSWTGRLAAGESARFRIGFRGRGLDSFTYLVDPELPVRNLSLAIDIKGGEGFDYAAGVVPATSTRVEEDGTTLLWEYASLESGFPFGVVLPSVRSFDTILITLIRRSWATFLLFFGAVIGLSLFCGRPLARVETYLVSSAYGFFFVLIPYLTAYMNFYLAYALSLLGIGGLVWWYLVSVLGARASRPVLVALAAFLFLPTLAVIFEEHTGLLYSILILIGLAAAMGLSQMPSVRGVITQLEAAASETLAPTREATEVSDAR